MAEDVRVARPIEEALATATMKVSEAHMLLSGIVESAVHPGVQASAKACLETLDSGVTDLREVAVRLQHRFREEVLRADDVPRV